ncbi:DUF3450 domain-containing protein [Stenotrophobium rhamnosiphilum]|uniref:DUF3450 domain-containing protein n=1 Tax=Stenotrophobium rhamnosiphilum TaxID=2029166 RepID=UPI001F0DD41A|nr:DUF3450 domain-containing protein [Stenotrophobium rhamnosiphilum]
MAKRGGSKSPARGWSYFVLLVLLTGSVELIAQAADPVGQAIDASQAANNASKASQQRVNSTDDQTKQMLERYRAATWQAQQLNVYAQQLEEIAGQQDTEKVSLQRQLVEMDNTDREIMPLMLRMLNSLEKFVSLDLPFLKQERQDRIASLKRLMADPEANTSEKYKRILEAYSIEADYGRTLGVERADVDGKVVDILHVGRTALFFLSIDGDAAGRWDANAGKWEKLDHGYVKSVRQGMRIAREQTAADLLTLPMPTPAGAAK